MVNRKVDTNKEHFSWLDIKHIRIVKGDLAMYFQYSHDVNIDMRKVDFARRGRGRPSAITTDTDLIEAYNGPQTITTAKFRDLQSLLPFCTSCTPQFL